MLRGRFEEAWTISDDVLTQRRPHDADRPDMPPHLRFVWDGTPLEGKSVLVRCYHGLGDTIQFIRCAPMLKRIAHSVAVQAQPELLPLLKTMRGIDTLVPLDWSSPDPEHEAAIELMEIPHALRLAIAHLPGPIPYLRPPAPPTIQRDDRLRVGVAWAAGDWDPQRSMPLRALDPLAVIPGVAWFSLQRGGAESELNRGAGPRVENPHDRSLDISLTAQLIAGLDLVISVDTMVAHLSGAMGKRTWLLLHNDADWRWLTERDDSPWYPTMRLFRQTAQGDWTEPVARVADRLRHLTRRAEREPAR